MHKKDAERYANRAINDAVMFLAEVLGDDEDMVLLTESGSEIHMDLWLFVLKRRDIRRPVFVVADGPVGNLVEYHEFDELAAARNLYTEVRAAGSWAEYHEDRKREGRP